MKERLNLFTAAERKIAEKLNKLTDLNTFWDDVRKMTAKVTSDSAIRKWEYLSDIRYTEILTNTEDVQTDEEYGQPTRYYTYDWKNEVFPIGKGA